MSLPAVATARAGNLLRRFRSDSRGSYVVEFALIAPIFFALLFAIIESSLVFFAGQYLETGVADASRAIYTSQVQTAGTTQANFKQSVCDRVAILFACPLVYIDVRSYPPGTPITITDPIDGAGNFVNNFVYQPPPNGSNDTVVVRGFYQWPLIVTGLGFNIANIGRGSSNSFRLLAATAAFRPQ
jgi:Flp pilus assembly protein TadG